MCQRQAFLILKYSLQNWFILSKIRTLKQSHAVLLQLLSTYKCPELHLCGPTSTLCIINLTFVLLWVKRRRQRRNAPFQAYSLCTSATFELLNIHFYFYRKLLTFSFWHYLSQNILKLFIFMRLHSIFIFSYFWCLKEISNNWNFSWGEDLFSD